MGDGTGRRHLPGNELVVALWNCWQPAARTAARVGSHLSWRVDHIRPGVLLLSRRGEHDKSQTRGEFPQGLPAALEDHAGKAGVDELIVAPGLVYRRDAVDRSHVGEPDQVDLWRICSTPATDDADMLMMISLLVDAVLPGAEWTVTDVTHPYTVGGRQVDVLYHGEWLELAECGRIHPDVLRGSGLDPEQWLGLALGMGLERALMLRKSIPDIRYLRAADPRIASQMLTLEPWQHVSPLPASRRDISVVLAEEEDEETLGDRIRTALGDDADVIHRSKCSAAPLTRSCRACALSPRDT